MVDFIDDFDVRIVQEIPNQLVVHFESVEEFVSIKYCIAEFLADLGFYFPHFHLDHFLVEAIAHDHEIHHAVGIVHEDSRCYEKRDFSRAIETRRDVRNLHAAGIDKQVAKRIEQRKILVRDEAV